MAMAEVDRLLDRLDRRGPRMRARRTAGAVLPDHLLHRTGRSVRRRLRPDEEAVPRRGDDATYRPSAGCHTSRGSRRLRRDDLPSSGRGVHQADVGRPNRSWARPRSTTAGRTGGTGAVGRGPPAATGDQGRTYAKQSACTPLPDIAKCHRSTTSRMPITGSRRRSRVTRDHIVGTDSFTHALGEP